MTTNQPTCAERIAEHLADRLADFAAMLGRPDPDEPDDTSDDLPPIQEYPLGVFVERTYRIKVELSTGGPADYITADVDDDGDIVAAAYHFADWFDHAEVDLRANEDHAAALGAILRAYVDLDELDAYAGDR